MSASSMLLMACAANENSAEWQDTTSHAGDTAIVTTLRGANTGAIAIDSVSIVWQSDTLGQPSQVVVAGADNLAVADRDRIFVVGQDGTLRRTLGRHGEGPGEFQNVGAIGGRGDTIVGLDGDNRHFSVFHTNGALLASGALHPAPEYVNLLPSRVGFDREGIVVAWNSIISGGGTPGTAAAVRNRWNGDSGAVISTVVGQPYVIGPTGNVARAMLFGPNPMAAVSAHGRVALSDGVEYCLSTMNSNGGQLIRICREWDRVPVGASVRNPDWNALASASGRSMESLQSIRGVVEMMKVADRRNAIDRFFWDAANRLWVEVVDARSANVHPILVRLTPDSMPTHTRFDVYSSGGQLVLELLLPRQFVPTDATANRVFGVYETEEGEQAVGAISLPPERKRTR